MCVGGEGEGKNKGKREGNESQSQPCSTLATAAVTAVQQIRFLASSVGERPYPFHDEFQQAGLFDHLLSMFAKQSEEGNQAVG